MPIIRSVETNEIVTCAWVKLDLTRYLGSETCNKIPGLLYDFSGKYVGKDTIYSYFECSKYGMIYIDSIDLLYIYDSSLKHDDILTSKILKKAVNYIHACNNVINIQGGVKYGRDNKVQAKAS